jgi:arylsulfatase A-like enzyme
MKRAGSWVALMLILSLGFQASPGKQFNNVIVFVADGLRGGIVDSQTAPNLAALRDRGVFFENSHSLFPTFTMSNASAMATGHYLGDTGIFSSTAYVAFPVPSAGGNVTPFLENDAALNEIDAHFGDYLNEVTLLKAAHDAGFSTAAVGKVGPVLMWDHAERPEMRTLIVDDSTGGASGIPVNPEAAEAIRNAGLSLTAPSRGENGDAGTFEKPGTKSANIAQQAYFVDVVTKALLPMFKARNKPFVVVYWSRDPDGSQHNQGDSLNQLSPGINGPTSLAAVKNADENLGKIEGALRSLGLLDTTNIFVTSDHGVSTVLKESETSPSAHASFKDVLPNHLPPGFLALDLASMLGLPVFDPDEKNVRMAAGMHGRRSNGLIGESPSAPQVVVAANGGSDLVYVPSKNRPLVARIAGFLMQQDYLSGLFVDDALGPIPGALPLSSINLKGSSVTPQPSFVVNFRSFDTGCGKPLNCAVSVADTIYQQGQGQHGSFSRADTLNFMAAAGPDFKQRFVDPAPVSNADIAGTIANLLGLGIKPRGKLLGRVIREAIPGGTTPQYRKRTIVSAPGPGGLTTILNYQMIGDMKYFDAGGFAGRTVGLQRN